MKKYQICLPCGAFIEMKADRYNVNDNGRLDLMSIDNEGLETYIATFKSWFYIRVI